MKGENKKHFKSLDGLRGLAALSVIFLHYFGAFAPFVVNYAFVQKYARLGDLMSATPLGLPFAANFAVCIFFVLSGFVLSLSFLHSQDVTSLTSSAARRYFRLMIPAAGSVILAYILLRAGFIYAHKAAIDSGSPWLGSFWNFPAHAGQAIFQSIYYIWFTNFNPTLSYNFALWTMHYELFGSFLIFMFLALFGKVPNRWLMYGIFALLFIKTYYLGFIAGMFISDVTYSYPNLMHKIKPIYVWLSLLLAIMLGVWSTSSYYNTFYNHLSLPYFTSFQLEIFAHIVGAVIVVVAVLRLDLLQKILETRPLQYLGKVSFSVYLLHPVVLGSVASYIFYKLEPGHGIKIAFLCASLIALPLTFIMASVYVKIVDFRAIALSKKLGNVLLNGNIRNLSLKPAKLTLRLHPKQPVPITSSIVDR